ncbi:MAG: hypothetical protein ACPMAQ_01095, partial [Phycisphaerae bacterium]
MACRNLAQLPALVQDRRGVHLEIPLVRRGQPEPVRPDRRPHGRAGLYPARECLRAHLPHTVHHFRPERLDPAIAPQQPPRRIDHAHAFCDRIEDH